MKTKERLEADCFLLKAALRGVFEAVKEADRQEIFDNLGHCEDGGAFWSDAMDRAAAALKTAEEDS